MSLLRLLLSALPLALCVSADTFGGNLNYRSPSTSHLDLGISLPSVMRRNIAGTSFAAKDLKFTHGVASGDPYPESIILWTRVAPSAENSDSIVTVSGTAPLYDHENDAYVRVSTAPVCVEYKVAEDAKLTKVVDSGRILTSSDIDYTVKASAAPIRSCRLALTCHRSRQRD